MSATQSNTSRPPSLPCRFRGTVQVAGANVPDGTIITALIDGSSYVTKTPAEGYGPSTYAIKISPPANVTYTRGKTVTFKIGEHMAAQTGSWEVGGNIVLNLTAS